MRNQGYEYRERIQGFAGDRSVLDYLAASYRHSTRSEWRRRILEGRVHLDGRHVFPETLVRNGQELVWHRPPWTEPDVPRSFAVLHRDRHVLAVAKPAGLPCQPAGGFLCNTLQEQVRRRWPEASLVHRLGRGTSGVVLLARTDLARASLARAFRQREVRKIYRALIQGRPREDRFVITHPIGKVPHPALGLVHAVSASGKSASTEVRLVQSRQDGSSLVDVFIETGRPHQIRIHLAAVGHPLLADPFYGPGGEISPEARLGDIGYRLHARVLSVQHPSRSGRLSVECLPPPILRSRGQGGRENVLFSRTNGPE